MKAFFIIASLLLMASCFQSPVADAQTAHAINEIIGLPAHGDSLLIYGAGFGEKAQAAPNQWDDFESGTPGVDIQAGSGQGAGWYTNAPEYGGEYAEYSTDYQRTAGSISSKQYPTGDSYISVDFPGYATSADEQIYISGWFYGTNTGESHSNKFMQINADNWMSPQMRTGGTGGTGGNYNSETLDCDSSDGPLANSDEEFSWVPNPYNTGEWHRWEWFAQLGNQGTFKTYRDGVLWSYPDPDRPGSSDFTFSGCVFRSVYFSTYWGVDGIDPTTTHAAYWDELYIDMTQQRVELGDASTWDACTHREIQIPYFWEDEEIAITCNFGTFAADADLWLYVVNETGAVTPGFAITGADSSSDRFPPPNYFDIGE